MSGQTDFAEGTAYARLFRRVITLVEDQDRNLREDFSSELKVTRRGIKTTRQDLEATRRKFWMWLGSSGS
jgi:hypothetical protein